MRLNRRPRQGFPQEILQRQFPTNSPVPILTVEVVAWHLKFGKNNLAY